MLLGAALSVWLAGGCSSSVPQPLEAPAGTSESAPATTSVEVPPSDPVAAALPPSDPVETTPAPPTAAAATTVAAPEPEPESEPVVEPVPDPEPEVQPVPEPEPDDESVVMIDTGARDLTERPQTLAEAAQVERERRRIAEPTDIVITDKNLSDYATGQLTVVQSSASSTAGASEPSKAERERAEQEAYWRGRALEIRQSWRDAYDRIPELEEKVFELRQAFYREDNGFYRDSEIKPAWDRAIEQLEEARLEVEARQEELAAFLEEGREAGALPGWLREGIDLEPDMQVVEEPTAEPSEPVIYQQEASDPP